MEKIGFTSQYKVRQCSKCQGCIEFYCYTCKHYLCVYCNEKHSRNTCYKYHKVVFFTTRNGDKNLTTQCNVRLCSECHNDVEFYCCGKELCVKCKDRHAFNLETKFHDIEIYRERHSNVFEYDTKRKEMIFRCKKYKQEPCFKHPETMFETFCISCGVPACVLCKEHRKPKIFPSFLKWIRHRKHNIVEIRTAYETGRKQHRKIICKIRGEILYNNCFLLDEIKSDLTRCHRQIYDHKLEISKKAHRIKELLDTLICGVEVRHKRFIQSLKQQKRNIFDQLSSIVKYEQKIEILVNRPVKLFFFLRRSGVPKIKETPNITRHALVMNEENKEDVIMLLSQIQISETGKRHVRIESTLKPMSTAVFHDSFMVVNSGVIHFSLLQKGSIWISTPQGNLYYTNRYGESDHEIVGKHQCYRGEHTLNINDELIFIGKFYNIYKLSRDLRQTSTLIEKKRPWEPFCVYCSPLNGDLLVGMRNIETKKGRVVLYSDKGHHIQTMQHDNTGQDLYSVPRYITENRNRDVIVSDWHHGVVVTERSGKHRFSYRGPTSRHRLLPCGICTDPLSNILVCDAGSHTVHLVDVDGNFLSLILTQQHGINIPYCLGYDDKNNLLLLGSSHNTIKEYRYICRKDCLKEFHSIDEWKNDWKDALISFRKEHYASAVFQLNSLLD